MKMTAFSPKQMKVLCWWCERSPFKDKEAVICDGSVRSGKTISMGISFIMWAFYRHSGRSFGICGKTIRNIKRNMVNEMLPVLKELGFSCNLKQVENKLELSLGGRENSFYLFGGKDESSAALIQGMTLAGVLFDEVALMPRSFVEQALARCSVTGAKFWFNCNPEHPNHWFYKEWILKEEERNLLYIHFTMKDNPSLSKATIARYKNMFSGSFYKRFVEGKWVKAEGLVYPFMENSMYCSLPEGRFEKFVISVDYGTVNPTSMGLWALKNEVWYRVDEYYYSSRETGNRRTDEEHLLAMKTLAEGRKIDRVIVDPSATSFIELIRKNNFSEVVAAQNDVLNGIRKTSSALKTGKIKICSHCKDSIKEFSLYSWNDDISRDTPIKENDHAMDEIRYFAVWALRDSSESFVFTVNRE